MFRSVNTWLLAVGLIAVTWAGPALDRRSGGRDGAESLLYLPNGQHLRLASLGHETLLADLIYLWAIQYYSAYDREDRFQYVEHVFGSVIAELDPEYIDAYWMGALILSVEAHDLDAGLRVLDKGIEANPDAWVLPYLGGWECYHAGKLDRAREYFARAARIPGAPVQVRRMQAGVTGRAGDLLSAAQLWREVLDDPDADKVSRVIARRQLRQLQTKIDLRKLQAAVERFRSDNERWPRSLEELTRRRYISHVPTDHAGRGYRYDPQSGRVMAPGERLLENS